MKVSYRKTFLKELAKIPPEIRKNIEQFVFEELPKADSFYAIGNIEKMTGYSSFYKIRYGSYRVGIRIDGDDVILERVLHRKEIYRYFP
jgi:mRNA interferase RelE/StbE